MIAFYESGEDYKTGEVVELDEDDSSECSIKCIRTDPVNSKVTVEDKFLFVDLEDIQCSYKTCVSNGIKRLRNEKVMKMSQFTVHPTLIQMYAIAGKICQTQSL